MNRGLLDLLFEGLKLGDVILLLGRVVLQAVLGQLADLQAVILYRKMCQNLHEMSFGQRKVAVTRKRGVSLVPTDCRASILPLP